MIPEATGLRTSVIARTSHPWASTRLPNGHLSPEDAAGAQPPLRRLELLLKMRDQVASCHASHK